MEKLKYNQPITEALDLKGGNLMLSVSPGAPTDPSSPPPAGMPSRGDFIP